MFPKPELDTRSDVPLYKQLYDHIRRAIETGQLLKGERLPATRALAGIIGLNRTTVTAAYERLESEGLIRRHVGRGSFVEGVPGAPPAPVRWQDLFVETELEIPRAPEMDGPDGRLSFATSRPSEKLFPLDDVHATVNETLKTETPDILQLGSPTGYPPLRRYLMETARKAGTAREEDDVIVTSGCQQALDLLQRVLIGPGDTVAVEDPVYPGVHHVLARAGARLAGVPVGRNGMDIERLARTLAVEKPKLLIVTPDFQNPTGATLPLEARRRLLELARNAGTVVAENGIYSGLRYEGSELPSLKQLDESGIVIHLRSFSKLAFPGLRVGWVVGPHALIARLARAKLWSDLHTDQLSQAVLCRFAISGRLEKHRRRVVAGGKRRLVATLEACKKYLPEGARYYPPQGGMNLWLDLPEPLDAGHVLARARRAGVDYLPGSYFAVSRSHTGSLRLCFAGLSPEQIEEGLSVLGKVFEKELDRIRCPGELGEEPAIV